MMLLEIISSIILKFVAQYKDVHHVFGLVIWPHQYFDPLPCLLEFHYYINQPQVFRTHTILPQSCCPNTKQVNIMW